ncbi:tryptophan--tRNA ligase [Candidatus Saccharibacteria bacterium]|nr:tryptophan--tRNA ligase [Candidatus Saccharibacteria bacterium]
MSKPVILTGLRANNNLHIGNYLGALLPIIDIANNRAGEFQINLFVPDLHSFTTPVDHSKLHKQIMENLRVYVAAGLPLDNASVYVYRQSYVPAHSELAWIIGCFTGFGELSRMTEFKDKSKRLGVEHIGAGQFNYPPLMAADILLYQAEYVPVGDDQRQNIEFTRNIAERMNSRFGKLFTVPKSVKEQSLFFAKDQSLRIRDLVDPTKKMSKSDETGRGVIFLNDKLDLVRKKIMSATTDSYGRIAYNPAEQAGLANLIDILGLFSGQTLGQVCKQYVGQSTYGPLKEATASAVVRFLETFQVKLADVNDKYLLEKLEASEAVMQDTANNTLLHVQKAVGLRPKK